MDVCSICHNTFTHECGSVVIVKHGNDRNIDMSRKRGHYFHRECIDEWKRSCVEKELDNICPLDRDPISRLYTVPNYQLVGFDISIYNTDFKQVLSQVKVTSKVLDQFDDINEVDRNNKTLAYYACRYGNMTLIRALLRKGANFNQPCGDHNFTPLMSAVCQGYHKIVQRLLSVKTVQEHCNASDGYHETAFGYACKHHFCNIIAEFLNHKLVTKHQVTYCLQLYYDSYKKDTLFGDEIIDRLLHYLKP